MWNEPDIFFWQGTTEEYLKLYDYAAQAVKTALPNAPLGGPTSTAPKNEKSAVFLREFLQHCSTGTNYATGKKGSPLDYISFHTKGAPDIDQGYVRMGMQAQLTRADWAFKIIAGFTEYKDTPIIVGESDPEGTAAYNVIDRPENVYRQGPICPAYNASVYKKLNENAQKYGLKLIGNLTWAFQFEGQPYFAGFRELATNGINKAVLNGFRLVENVGSESQRMFGPARRLQYVDGSPRVMDWDDDGYLDLLIGGDERRMIEPSRPAHLVVFHGQDVDLPPKKLVYK